MANMTHQQFKATYFTNPTRYIDADGNNDPQCVDIPKLYWAKVYNTLCGSFNGSAAKATQNTFPGARRLQAGPSVALRQGDVVIFAPTPTNQHGHVCVVDAVDKDGFYALEQHGYFTNKYRKKVPGLPPRIWKYTWDKKIQDIWRK